MISKTIVVIALSSLFMTAPYAASQENASIEVSYTASTANFRQGGNSRPNRYILLANAHDSKFYSPMTEYLDSLQSTPEGDARYKEMARGAYLGGNIDKMPRRDGSYYIFKSADENKITSYDINGVEKYFYEEEIPAIDWELTDSTATILGYTCQMATADFRGRNWSVWFAPDVPVASGPWKLGGLPGLILKATDSSGLYDFEATGLQQTSRPMVPVYSAGDYEKTDRKEFLKAKRQFIDNPVSSINTQLSGVGISIGALGNEIKHKPRKEIDFIETDY